MANITGYVQSIDIFPGGSLSFTKVGIGPSPSDIILLLILAESTDSIQELLMKASMVDTLSTALAVRREVTVYYDDSNSRITFLEMNKT